MKPLSQIANGLACWLAFERACGRGELFAESYLAHPLGQLLQHQYPGRVSSEQVHPILADESKAGRRPSVDFVVKGPGALWALALETKWVSTSNTLLRDTLRDIVRLDLLHPTISRDEVLVVAGTKKGIDRLLSDPRVQPHPANPNSTHILPVEGHHESVLRFFPVPKFRKSLYKHVLEPFAEREVSTSICLRRYGPYPEGATPNEHVVVVWLLVHKSDQKFKPADHYGFHSVSPTPGDPDPGAVARPARRVVKAPVTSKNPPCGIGS